MKALLSAALMLPVLALSGVAYAGPNSTYPPANMGWKGGPYAMTVPATHSDGSTCLYQGGPKSPIWHQYRR